MEEQGKMKKEQNFGFDLSGAYDNNDKKITEDLNKKKPVFKGISLPENFDAFVSDFLGGDAKSKELVKVLCERKEKNVYIVDDPSKLPELYLEIFKLYGNGNIRLDSLNVNWFDTSGWEIKARKSQSDIQNEEKQELGIRTFQDPFTRRLDNLFDRLSNGGDLDSANSSFEENLIKLAPHYDDYKYMVTKKEQLPVLIRKVFEVCGTDTDISWIDTSNWEKVS